MLDKITSKLPLARRGREKGFSLVEILIVLAIVGGLLAAILATTGKAGQSREVRRAVQDINDIAGAMSEFFGSARISGATAVTVPTAVRLEGVAAAALEHLQDPGDTDTIMTQFGTNIAITSGPTSSGNYFWPNYWITYTGLRSETCGPLLGALTAPIAVQVTSAETPILAGAWGVGFDHRVQALTSATSVEDFCNSNTGDETYTVHAVFRI